MKCALDQISERSTAPGYLSLRLGRPTSQGKLARSCPFTEPGAIRRNRAP
jgi:hypothetical protein